MANLTAEQQTLLCEHVIAEVEKLGVEIVHVSTDNHAINTKMFKILNNKYPCEQQLDSSLPAELMWMIVHPFDANRRLYLSFDPCDILKNIRNMFIERPLQKNGKNIDFRHYTRLYQQHS